MRLLNAQTLVLEEYFEHNVPPYAILSHRWRDGEVSFQDIQGATPTHKTGYEKIRQTCLRALGDGLNYAWVDTCCIDKSSSAELSESINAMYRWYRDAAVCYAYLADVEDLASEGDQASALAGSEWFERGWTLQELLAPTKLVFYSSDWSPIGDRAAFLGPIERRTGIDRQFLTFLDQNGGHSIQEASVAERMSWASGRRTTRSEDVAYCMLGILGISMPLLYGEGEAAFIRLQEELVRQSDDQTILAWDIPLDPEEPSTQDAIPFHSYGGGVLARSPAAFANRGNLIPRRGKSAATAFSVTNKGIAIKAPSCQTVYDGRYLMLSCGPKDDPTTMIALPLCSVGRNHYARGKAQPIRLSYYEWKVWRARQVHLLVRPVSPALDRGFKDGGIWIRRVPDGFQFDDASPPDLWSPCHRIVDIAVRQKSLLTVRPTLTFVLRPSAEGCGASAVRVSLVPSTLWFKPLRARCGLVRARAEDGHAQAAEGGPTDTSTRVPGASYVRLTDGAILYVTASQRSILSKKFLIVDVRVARNSAEANAVLLRHFLADCLFLPTRLTLSIEALTSSGTLTLDETDKSFVVFHNWARPFQWRAGYILYWGLRSRSPPRQRKPFPSL